MAGRAPGRPPGHGLYRGGQRAAGFGLVELLVALTVVAVLVAILLPALAHVRRSARQTAGAVQARSVHQGLVSFAEGNGGWYPGRGRSGEVTTAMVEKRFAALLQGGFITGDTLISPADPVSRPAWSAGDIHRSQYSYALPVITTVTGMASERAAEFSDSLNSEAIAITDRAIRNGGSDSAGLHLRSIHTRPASDTTDWQGTVVWNDGRASFAGEPRVASRYGSVRHSADHLFASPGDSVLSNAIPFAPDSQHDALMSSYGVVVGVSDD